MTDKKQMMIAFITALTDVLKDEEDRELDCVPKIDIEAVRGNDLVLSMFRALQCVCNEFLGREDDPLEFISVLTKLLFQEERERLTGVCEDETAEEGEDRENACSDK